MFLDAMQMATAARRKRAKGSAALDLDWIPEERVLSRLQPALPHSLPWDSVPDMGSDAPEGVGTRSISGVGAWRSELDQCLLFFSRTRQVELEVSDVYRCQSEPNAFLPDLAGAEATRPTWPIICSVVGSLQPASSFRLVQVSIV
jgi:hypothetical protein